ncbi:MAG TPA: DUF2975 domain-containing protein [Tenuifilaceae bacterium]|nr:DUF2975 domain-containing protein [Tenuifilaceae bacterium]
MKKLTKDSLAHILSAIVDILFKFQIFLVLILIPTLFIQTDILTVRLEQLIEFTLILLILWNIRKIFKAFRNNTFYDISIIKALRYLSIILVAYVLVDYIFMIIKDSNLIDATTGYMFLDIIYYYVKPIKFSLLFLSAISYLLSFVVKEGCELKEENSLIV